jgi:hypothetical protein
VENTVDGCGGQAGLLGDVADPVHSGHRSTLRLLRSF